MDSSSLPKVLYIEDTPEARWLVRRVLAQEFTVLEACDPLTGIEIAIQSRPDLILLDINLPHLNGREAAARLKHALPNSVLVAFSADVSSGARERALAAGCAGYLTKPLDVDTFADQLREFLGGKREVLVDEARHHDAFEAELVERLEAKVRELTVTAERNALLNEQNQRLVIDLQRRQRLLEAAARSAQVITSILDLDALLQVTVDTICGEYGYDYAGIFLLDESGEWAVLNTGSGPAGAALLAEQHRLPVNGRSMVGSAIRQRQARLALDVGDDETHFKNPYLPNTRSEMDLPLVLKDKVLGVLSVQSEQVNAFKDEDITALQTLANQVAVAINNAQLLRDLDQTHRELLRTKTFEAIAQTTGETIHWVGNKAAPIPSSACRVREDLAALLAVFQVLLQGPAGQAATLGSLSELAAQAFQEAAQHGLQLPELAGQMEILGPHQRQALGGVASILEDLAIIEQSARNILDIKENLIGPIRLQHLNSLDLPALVERTVFEMGLPAGLVELHLAPGLPLINGDARQLGQVFNNLIKNAWEAVCEHPQPCIQVKMRMTENREAILCEVIDNGPGIPPELLEKIWVSFFTTKGTRGGTGLGLSACIAIINQFEGKISVKSEVGSGTTFTVLLPVKNGPQPAGQS